MLTGDEKRMGDGEQEARPVSNDALHGAPGAAGSGDGPVQPPASPELPELEEALREREQFKKLLQRTQADFINFRNRSQDEARQARKAGVRSLAGRVIEVLDLFDAAMAALAQGGVETKWAEGVRAIQKSLTASLGAEGVVRMAPSGAVFDPRLHEALMSTARVGVAPGTVLRELRPGYMHDGDVIRPAQVEVAAEAVVEEGGQRPGIGGR